MFYMKYCEIYFLFKTVSLLFPHTQHTPNARQLAILSTDLSSNILRLQIAGQLHSHKDPSEEKRNENKDKAHRSEQDVIKLSWSWSMSLVHYDKSHASNEKQERTGQTLHNVLSVNAIWHECDLDLR